MRILIDECLDWRLERGLPGHECPSVPRMGWSGIKNGRLLALMREAGFDVFLTADRNLQFQQNLPPTGVAVIVLAAPSTRLVDPLPPTVSKIPLTKRRITGARRRWQARGEAAERVAPAASG